MHYSRCQLFIGDFEFPPKGKATEPRTLPYVRPAFLSAFRFLSDFSVSLPLALAPHPRTGNPRVHATYGTALRQGRHPDSPALLTPLTASEFPGQNNPRARNTNVCSILFFLTRCRTR